MKPWCERQWVTPAGTSMRSAIPNEPATVIPAVTAQGGQESQPGELKTPSQPCRPGWHPAARPHIVLTPGALRRQPARAAVAWQDVYKRQTHFTDGSAALGQNFTYFAGTQTQSYIVTFTSQDLDESTSGTSQLGTFCLLYTSRCV